MFIQFKQMYKRNFISYTNLRAREEFGTDLEKKEKNEIRTEIHSRTEFAPNWKSAPISQFREKKPRFAFLHRNATEIYIY